MSDVPILNHRVVVTRRGGPDVLGVVEEPLPEPGAGDVRIRVEAAGVSGYDVTSRTHRFPGSPKPPFTLGEDIVGIVDEVGSGVSDLEPGQRVAGWTFGDGGGYSEYVCRPVEQLVLVPEGLDAAEAVCLVINYLTAHLYLYQTARVQAGERVLVQGAAGGVGTALLQLGKLADLDMYGTASTHNHELVVSLGATPIDYRSEEVVGRTRKLTRGGVDVVLDLIAGARQLWRSYRCLRKGGRLVMMGSVEASERGLPSIVPSLLLVAGLKLLPDGRRVPMSPNMTDYPFEHPEWYRATLEELLQLGASGTIKPVIAERIPLTEARRAHELLARGGYAGKVVLTTAPELSAALPSTPRIEE